VSGPVEISASAPEMTARVEFRVDGALVASSDSAPFTATWDTFSSANGVHAIEARAIDRAGSSTASAPIEVTVSNHIRHVFVIMMENHDWSAISRSPSAPYINGTLLAQGAHAENYRNVPGLHPSLPNYLWLEAGGNLGIWDDGDPAVHLQSTPQHLVALLDKAGISWKSYQEGIDGTSCPLTGSGRYAPKHNPMIYFGDVTDSNDAGSARCIAHVRPYTELARDLETRAVPGYSFITPDLCDDMHDSSGCASADSVANGDAWLSREVPKILASRAYQEGGALFITWDESESGDVPIGMIVLSPLAKGGYSSKVAYDHSSTLRSLQEIFGVTPILRAAAGANDLGDLFRSFP
jgi:hypothetical protein